MYVSLGPQQEIKSHAHGSREKNLPKGLLSEVCTRFRGPIRDAKSHWQQGKGIVLLEPSESWRVRGGATSKAIKRERATARSSA